MSFTESYANVFRRLLPAPFTIALFLTLISFILALFFGSNKNIAQTGLQRTLDTMDLWYNGIWNPQGFSFAIQMMLMLLLGHVMALSKPIDGLLSNVTSSKACNSQSNAALTLSSLTILVSLFNWGLGLVFGALFARKIGEHYTKTGKLINYGFIGACGYVGLMVWHAGISGSAPIKVADNGHIAEMMEGGTFTKLPDSIPLTETIFSTMNITVMFLVLILISSLAFILGKRLSGKKIDLQVISTEEKVKIENRFQGAERIDQSSLIAKILGAILMFFAIYKAIDLPGTWEFRFLSPNFINFTLLSLCLLLHKNFNSFLSAIDSAIGGISGILIQFPLYYGILALMKDSGIVSDLSVWISGSASEKSFPIYTYLSSAIMNVFVPSGGGQWVVQGPIIIETAVSNNISLGKSIMAMAYGDQLTNMMQPFWALPLLGITRLKAKQILPYTLMFMITGFAIYLLALIIF